MNLAKKLLSKTGVVADEIIFSRRIFLKPADFWRHGYSDGCPRCIYFRTGIRPNQYGGNHTVSFRNCMEAQIALDPDDMRLKQATKRYEHLITEKIAEGDQKHNAEQRIGQQKEVAEGHKYDAWQESFGS